MTLKGETITTDRQTVVKVKLNTFLTLSVDRSGFFVCFVLFALLVVPGFGSLVLMASLPTRT